MAKRFVVSVAVAAAALTSMTAVGSANPVRKPAAAHRVFCNGHAATIVGTNGNDRIIGTNGPDVIAALGGDDLVLGLGGNDLICGGTGNDVLNAMSGTGHQPMYGGPGTNLCIFPHQEASVEHGCNAQNRPDPLNSDPPAGGTSEGNVLRAQSVAVSTACTASNGAIKLTIKGKVSANSDQSADIFVEPSIFRFNRADGTWQRSDLQVHRLTLPGYDGTWHSFTVHNTDTKDLVNRVYYIGYYIQWFAPDGQTIDGNQWTFVGNYPKTLRGATHNVGLCLPGV